MLKKSNDSKLIQMVPDNALLSVSNVDTFQFLLPQFLASIDIKPNSKVVYASILKSFHEWLILNAPLMITNEVIRKWRDQMAQEKQVLTVNTYLSVVKEFFAWMADKGIHPDEARKIRPLKRPKGFRKDFLIEEQIADLLKVPDVRNLKGKRDYALLNLMLRTGLRAIEVIRADYGDLANVQGKHVLYIQGKGRDEKDELVVLPPKLYCILLDYLTLREPLQLSSPLFVSVSNNNNNGRLTTRAISMIVKEHLVLAGLDSPRLTAHSLRHTAVTLARKAGASLQQTQQMARHSNINTTLTYDHYLDRIQDPAEDYIEEYLKI